MNKELKSAYNEYSEKVKEITEPYKAYLQEHGIELIVPRPYIRRIDEGRTERIKKYRI